MIGRKNEYLLMAEVETTHWWFKTLHWRVIHTLSNYLPTKDTNIALLDAGCGTGGLIRVLQMQGIKQIQALDASADAAILATELTGITVVVAPVQEVSHHFAAESFDAICCMDVMTYLQDQEIVSVLRQFSQLLRPGGIIVLNNNAYRAFRGTHDHQLGIGKRFIKKDFVNYATMASLTVLENEYWNFLLSPIVWLIRKWKLMMFYSRLVAIEKIRSDLNLPNKAVNKALLSALHWEARIIKRPPWGTSLFTVLQAPLPSKQ